MGDVVTDAFTAPAGRLAEVLLKRFSKEVEGRLPSDLSRRLNA